jgi:hypothetical protein
MWLLAALAPALQHWIFLSTAMTFVKVLKQAPVATYFMLTRLETFQPQGGESFYSTAVTFVKVLKQCGLGLIPLP